MTREYSKPSTMQRDVIAQARAESCLDPTVPLGVSPPARPEYGARVSDYYKWKHGPNGPGYGKYFPLHIVAAFSEHRSVPD
jgi:hypothetical protein